MVVPQRHLSSLQTNPFNKNVGAGGGTLHSIDQGTQLASGRHSFRSVTLLPSPPTQRETLTVVPGKINGVNDGIAPG